MRKVRETVLCLGAIFAAATACGYPDPGTGGDAPIAGTSLATPSPSGSTGGDQFTEGAGSKGVKLLDGLFYVDLKVGDGATVAKGDKISVQYTGWLAANGAKFDSSRDRGTPAEFNIGVGQVIGGWEEGVPGMKAGGRRRLVIPSALGYGTQGQGQTIPPNSDLVFVIEVVSVTPGPPASPSPTAPTPAPTPT